MAGKTIIMSKLKQIIRLRAEGTPLQTIAQAVSISRNTVKKYLRLMEVQGLPFTELLAMQDPELEALLADPEPEDEQRLQTLTSLFPQMENELRRTGVTRWLLWGEYRQAHPDGFSYSRFCDYFRQFLDSSKGSLRFDYAPGDKMFIDFTGKKMSYVDPKTGEELWAEIFVAILGYSQLTYVEAVLTQRLPDFIAAVENSYLFYGGVTRVVIPDNIKSAVQRADKYEAELNRTFLDFANHYGCSVLPARSYRPKDKAHVERAVNIVYSRIFAPLRNRTFYSLQQLNTAIREKLAEHNQLPFQQQPYSRQQRFDTEERAALLPLPAERFEIRYSKELTVMKNGHIQLGEERHYYSVPYRYIGCRVKVIYSATRVSVYYQQERIAFHAKGLKKYGHTTLPEHLASSNRFVSEWNPDKFLQWAAGISPEVKIYIARILDTAHYPEQAYRSCVGILSYEKKIGHQRFIRAIARATHFGAYNYTIIKRIIEGGLDMLALDEQEAASRPLPLHDNIRGAGAYQ